MGKGKTLLFLAALLCLHLTAGAQPEEAQPEEAQPEEKSTVFAFLERHLPHRLPMLEQMRAEDPAQYEVELRSFEALMAHYRQVQSREPELAQNILLAVKLEDETHQLGARIAQAPDQEQKEKLGQELRQKLTRIFDIKLAEKEMEVRLLEEEIKAFKGMLTCRRDLKDQIVERRYREIVGASSEETSWW